MPSGSTHVVTYDKIPFLFKAEKYSTVCIDHIFFICSSADKHLGSFHAMAPVDNAAMNMGSQTSILNADVKFFG